MGIQRLFYFSIISFIVHGDYTQQAEYINFCNVPLAIAALIPRNMKSEKFKAGIVSLFQLPMLYLHCICVVLVKCLRCICIVFILYLHCFTFQCWRPWPSLTPLQLPGVVAPFNNKELKIIQMQIQILIQIQI